MSDHYYTADPASAHDVRAHAFEALGLELTFWTDSGVFSKEGLDPGSALLLKELPPLHGRVLDMGCGWGALGVTLAKKYPEAHLVLSDINERAADLARRNLRENQVANAIVVTGDGFEGVEGRFDFIVTNPPIRAGKQAIYSMFEESVRRLNPAGQLFLVIRKQQGAPSALKFLDTLAPGARMIARDKGYWILRAQKTYGAQE